MVKSYGPGKVQMSCDGDSSQRSSAQTSDEFICIICNK